MSQIYGVEKYKKWKRKMGQGTIKVRAVRMQESQNSKIETVFFAYIEREENGHTKYESLGECSKSGEPIRQGRLL